MAEFVPAHAVGAVVMLVPTLVFAYEFVTDPRSRVYHAMLVGITGIATVAYALMTLGIGQVEVANGAEVFVVRYLDWLLTTPLMIAYLGLLAGVSRRVLVGSTALDFAMIGLGFVATTQTGILKWSLFAVSALCYVGLVYYLLGSVISAVQRRPQPVITLFEKLRNVTVIAWTFYPVIWILGPTGLGLMLPETEYMVITYADFVSKAVFGIIVFNSQQSLADLPELDALRLVGGSETGAGPGTGE